MLLEHGADTRILDSHLITPADRARVEGQKELASLLIYTEGNRDADVPDLVRKAEKDTMDKGCDFYRILRSYLKLGVVVIHINHLR